MANLELAVLRTYTGDYESYRKQRAEEVSQLEAKAERQEARRAELQSQYMALLLHLGRLSGSAGDLDEAEQCLRLVLQEDACQEDAAATLMGILAAAGRRIEALRIYQVLASALETTMDLAPSGEIV